MWPSIAPDALPNVIRGIFHGLDYAGDQALQGGLCKVRQKRCPRHDRIGFDPISGGNGNSFGNSAI
ncbi:MAG: hypothetical protein CL396_07305 [Acidiferrobacteraceae bacterium]|jgi:hypothetical protein|nr:hypothetical protein [Acidiferrobacteraceae bacterium]